MPYRRLPNTDSARLRALKKALEKGKNIPPFKLAFNQDTLQKLEIFLKEFEQAVIQQRQANMTQIKKNRKYLSIQRKARLYISHFIQVMNFSIARNEIPPSSRKFFQIKEYDNKVPPLNTEKEIIKWGERIIKGETQRIAEGNNPIKNPTSAVVKVRYDLFMDAYRHQKKLQEANERAFHKVSSMREKADSIIQSIWNEVENRNSNLPAQEKRKKAQEYGVVYVYRKDEKKFLDKKIKEIAKEEVMENTNIADKRKEIIEKNKEKEKKYEENFDLFQYSFSFR